METAVLNARQEAFVAAFCVCLNGAEAAREAGYAAKSARNTAVKLLKKPEIQEAIAAQREAALTDRCMDLREAMEIATSIARDTGCAPPARLKAVDTVAKLQGWEKQAQIQIQSHAVQVFQERPRYALPDLRAFAGGGAEAVVPGTGAGAETGGGENAGKKRGQG